MGKDEIMSKFDNESEELTVEEIMNKIRNNVRKRYGVTNQIYSEINGLGSCSQSCSESPTFDLKVDFEYANSNCNVMNKNYYISSHRPFVGQFLVKGRKLVHGEVKRYVDTSFSNQNNFNLSILKIVEKLISQLSRVEIRLNNIETKFNDNETKSSEIENRLNNAEIKCGNFESMLNNADNRLNNIEMKFKEIETKFTKNEIVSKKIENRIKEFDRDAEKTAWAELYSAEITEQDLVNNISYHEFFIELIKKYSKLSAAGRPARIIEVGLGNGTMSVYFSRDCNYDVYGIDNDIQVLNHNIKLNKKLGGYAKFMLVDAFDLNLFQEKFFDVSFSQGTLEHFENSSIVQLIRKQLDVSKYVIFSVPSINWPTRELGNERKMSLEDWKVILEDNGFNLLDLEYYKDDLHIVGVITG